ncbi:MAG: elongation factor G [Planctomycetota bacterium]|nr:MAG: elongation factor G [Planctomycetota bacterium]
MPSIPIKKMRNFGIIAHIDSGKTTVSERVLYFTGKNHKIGEVHEGAATMDWMKEEQERGITITAAATSVEWRGHFLNLIDTPGHVDFTAEVERSCRVLDGAVVVFCAVGGVQAQSETVWRQADKYKVPRLVFVNKMDRTGADYFSVVDQVRTRLHGNPVPIVYPVGAGDDLKGLIDLVRGRYVTFEGKNGEEQVEHPIPAEEEERFQELRTEMIEAIAQEDEGLMEKYLENGDLTLEEIMQGIKSGVENYLFQPVLTGSALKNIGVQLMLDAVVDFLPDPESVHNMNQFAVEDLTHENPIPTKPDPTAPLRALVFKVMTTPHGELSFVRVYQGTIKTGDQLFCPNQQKKERASRLVKLHAMAQTAIEDVSAGDICAIIGLKFAATGETLTQEGNQGILEGISFAEPVISMAIEPASNADKEKLANALAKMEREDPTFKRWTDPETGQLIIAGMGELHLEVLQHRMLDDFKVEAHVGKPRVSYREAISKQVQVRGKHVKQTGGSGQYGDCTVIIRPMTPDEVKATGKDFLFASTIKGGVVPKEYFPAIEMGIKQELARGFVAGYPVINVHVTLIDGSIHAVDSSEMAFRAAGALAMRNAFPDLGVQVLEPWMKVEAETPEDFTGSVIGSLNSKRAIITETLARPGTTVVRGEVPLSEMFGYTTELRSLSQGRAAFSMEPAEYKPVPNSMLEKIAKKG